MLIACLGGPNLNVSGDGVLELNAERVRFERLSVILREGKDLSGLKGRSCCKGVGWRNSL